MIFIPFEIFTRGVGGPTTFMKNLRQYLIKQDYPFTDEISKIKQSDIIFFPMSFNERILRYYKKNNKPIIQRLDGVYYPSKHGFKISIFKLGNKKRLF